MALVLQNWRNGNKLTQTNLWMKRNYCLEWENSPTFQTCLTLFWTPLTFTVYKDILSSFVFRRKSYRLRVSNLGVSYPSRSHLFTTSCRGRSWGNDWRDSQGCRSAKPRALQAFHSGTDGGSPPQVTTLGPAVKQLSHHSVGRQRYISQRLRYHSFTPSKRMSAQKH